MIAMVVQFENKSQHERGLELYLALLFGIFALAFNACLIGGRQKSHVRQFFQHLRVTVEFDLVSSKIAGNQLIQWGPTKGGAGLVQGGGELIERCLCTGKC